MSRFDESIAELPACAGVYMLINVDVTTAESRIYVGMAKNLHQRACGHRAELRKGTHHAPYLQSAWNKYGPDAFLVVVLEVVEDRWQRAAAERWWWEELGARYNAAIPNGEGGYECTDEIRARRSKAQRITFAKPEVRARRSEVVLRRYDCTDVDKWAVSPDGTVHHVRNYARFARDHNLDADHLCRTLLGKQKTHLGWRCTTPSEIRDAKAREAEGTLSSLQFPPANEFFITPIAGVVVDTNGHTHCVREIKSFAAIYGLHKDGLGQLLRGRQKTHRGWRRATDSEAAEARRREVEASTTPDLCQLTNID